MKEMMSLEVILSNCSTQGSDGSSVPSNQISTDPSNNSTVHNNHSKRPSSDESIGERTQGQVCNKIFIYIKQHSKSVKL